MRNKKLIILLSVLGGLALLIILASVIFSVHTVVAHCCNDTNDDADVALISAQVVEAADIGFTSIFMLNDKEIIERVDKNVVYAEMDNVERIFPNKVSLNYYRLYEDIWFSGGDGYHIASTSGKVLKVSAAKPNGIEVILGETPRSTVVGTYLNDAKSSDLIALGTLIDGLVRIRESGVQLFNKELYKKIDLSGEDVIIETTSGVLFELRCNTLTNKRANADVMFSQLRVAVTMYLNENFPITSGKYTIAYNHENSGTYSPTHSTT